MQEIFLKQTHQSRAEKAQAKREEKRRLEKERILEVSAIGAATEPWEWYSHIPYLLAALCRACAVTGRTRCENAEFLDNLFTKYSPGLCLITY